MIIFFVTEFQSRGSQHDHGLIWIKDAPCYELCPKKDVVDFIDRYISTDQSILPEDLQEIQTHQHKSTCFKRKKKCRFHFPRPPMLETMILKPFVDKELENFNLSSIKRNKICKDFRFFINRSSMSRSLFF